MKQILILTFLLSTLLGAVAQDDVNDGRQVQVRKIGSFDKVKASKGINVTLIEGDKESIEIHIKNANPDDVLTELKNKKLTVKMRTKIGKGVAVQVYVTYKTIREIESTMGSTIDANNTIYADKLVISAGSDASLHLEVDVNALEASVSAARIEMSGKAGFQEVSANTGGKYYAFPLESKEAYAKASIGGQIEVTATEKITANGNSGGSVTYRGNPDKVSMKGKVSADE